MKIDHIITMVRVGEITKQSVENKLKFTPDPRMTTSQLRDKRGRVYCVVVDGVIEKIGGSQDAGGIQGSIGWYLNGWAKGNSERTYCTWNFFTKALNYIVICCIGRRKFNSNINSFEIAFIQDCCIILIYNKLNYMTSLN